MILNSAKIDLKGPFFFSRPEAAKEGKRRGKERKKGFAFVSDRRRPVAAHRRPFAGVLLISCLVSFQILGARPCICVNDGPTQYHLLTDVPS